MHLLIKCPSQLAIEQVAARALLRKSAADGPHQAQTDAVIVEAIGITRIIETESTNQDVAVASAGKSKFIPFNQVL